MRVILIIVGVLKMISKGLEKRLGALEIGRRRIETLQTTEYLDESRRPEETCCHSDSSGRPSIKTGGQNSQVLYINLRPRQTCHSKDGGSAYSIGMGKLG